MTKKQTFICCAIGGLISQILLIPVYKKSYEENKKREEELLKQTDDMVKNWLEKDAERAFKKWHKES